MFVWIICHIINWWYLPLWHKQTLVPLFFPNSLETYLFDIWWVLTKNKTFDSFQKLKLAKNTLIDNFQPRGSHFSICSQPFLMFSIFSVPPTVSLDIGKALNLNDLEEGDDVYFECSISANPPPYKVTWLHNVSRQSVEQPFFGTPCTSHHIFPHNQTTLLCGVFQYSKQHLFSRGKKSYRNLNCKSLSPTRVWCYKRYKWHQNRI